MRLSIILPGNLYLRRTCQLEYNRAQITQEEISRVKIFTNPSFDEIRASCGEIDAGRISFRRTQACQARYNEHRQQLEHEGKTSADVIRGEAGESPIWITENAFPYELDGVMHYVLFVLEHIDLPSIEEHLQAWREKMEISLDDVIVFQNPHAFQSMNTIPHWHVMVRGNMLPK